MDIVSVYNDFLDRTAMEQNGIATIAKFNRYGKLAELRLLDYLSGDIEGRTPPEPYNVEKLRDWLTHFMTEDKKTTIDGKTPKPVDFYRFESLVKIGSYLDEVCGEVQLVSKGDTPIELLDPQQFDERCRTWVKDLVPSEIVPIAKMKGAFFEYMPKDMGTVKLEYIRYPVYGMLGSKLDTAFNIIVPDPATSVHYEWPEWARNILLYFIVQQYPIATRENALVQQNENVDKSSRG